MKALITGINGFAGAHLARLLLKEGLAVWGTIQPGTSHVCIEDICSKVKLAGADILDAEKMEDVILRARPDYIFHLAGISHVPTSWNNPILTCRINVGGTINCVTAMMKLKNKPRMLLISSGDVYGKQAADGKMLRENLPCLPLNPYGSSKAAAEMFAVGFCQAGKADIVVARPFNHIGPGQSLGFVTSDFAHQIARIEAGLQKPVVKVGDLGAYKDFTDVRDMVAAYSTAVKKCESGKIYNIAGGNTLKISKVLDILMELSGVKVKIVKDQKMLQPAARKSFKVDTGLFVKATGWKPRIDIRRTLKDILDYWRHVVNPGKSR